MAKSQMAPQFKDRTRDAGRLFMRGLEEAAKVSFRKASE
jgi:hypothetical protein